MLNHLPTRLLRAAMHGPQWLQRALTFVPQTIDGQQLDERTRLLLSLLRLNPLPEHWLSVKALRGEIAFMERSLSGPVADVSIRDIYIELPGRTLQARVYSPRGAGLLPGLLYLHGGGFVTGSPAVFDSPCARFSHDCPCVVVSVDYRLAPEHRFPAALDDAVDAFRWVAAHGAELGIAAGALAIGGDSAGGNLSAAASRLLTQESGPRPIAQLLIYPAVDMHNEFPSKRSFARGYFLTSPLIDWFCRHYLGANDGAGRRDPRASPLLHPDLRGLPPALLVLAGLDPLRDEGRAYGARLAAAGNEVDFLEVEGMVHGFITLDGVVPAAGQALDEMVRRLRPLLRWSVNSERSPAAGSDAALPSRLKM